MTRIIGTYWVRDPEAGRWWLVPAGLFAMATVLLVVTLRIVSGAYLVGSGWAAVSASSAVGLLVVTFGVPWEPLRDQWLLPEPYQLVAHRLVAALAAADAAVAGVREGPVRERLRAHVEVVHQGAWKVLGTGDYLSLLERARSTAAKANRPDLVATVAAQHAAALSLFEEQAERAERIAAVMASIRATMALGDPEVAEVFNALGPAPIDGAALAAAEADVIGLRSALNAVDRLTEFGLSG